MPIIVGISTFIDWLNFMLSRVEHEIFFITSEPDVICTTEMRKRAPIKMSDVNNSKTGERKRPLLNTCMITEQKTYKLHFDKLLAGRPDKTFFGAFK